MLWFVPKKSRAKLDHPWRCGVFLGRASQTAAKYIGIKGGTVVTARAIVRVVPQHRWNLDRVHAITAVLGGMKNSFDSIEAEADPHNFDAAELPDGEDPELLARRRLKITLKDLGRYHFSKNCPKDSLHSQHRHAQAQRAHHTEACRLRRNEAMRAAKDKDAGP